MPTSPIFSLLQQFYIIYTALIDYNDKAEAIAMAEINTPVANLDHEAGVSIEEDIDAGT